jgi:hypothetical protein
MNRIEAIITDPEAIKRINKVTQWTSFTFISSQIFENHRITQSR